MDGYVHCSHCGNWHAQGYECEAARRAREAAEIGEAPDPIFVCVECGRRVHLDDASVTTRHGRAVCLRCSRVPR